MADQADENKPVIDERTRAQAKKIAHEKAEEKRKAESEELKANYAKIKDEPALADILAKAKTFAAYHMKIAKDGMGSKQNGFTESGQPIIVDYRLTSEERIAHLDQASGQEQLIAYIENKLS